MSKITLEEHSEKNVSKGIARPTPFPMSQCRSWTVWERTGLIKKQDLPVNKCHVQAVIGGGQPDLSPFWCASWQTIRASPSPAPLK